MPPTPGSETILVVDDEIVILSLARLMLTRYGYAVLVAQGGRQVLDMLSNGSKPNIDLAVVDIVMPGMTGFEVAEEIRKNYPGIPVLFISGATEIPELNAALNHGIPYLRKPFTSISMVGKIREMLDG
jgi:two-component system, cell cycle sensor histidine kinase and response regulator CckA